MPSSRSWDLNLQRHLFPYLFGSFFFFLSSFLAKDIAEHYYLEVERGMSPLFSWAFALSSTSAIALLVMLLRRAHYSIVIFLKVFRAPNRFPFFPLVLFCLLLLISLVSLPTLLWFSVEKRGDVMLIIFGTLKSYFLYGGWSLLGIFIYCSLSQGFVDSLWMKFRGLWNIRDGHLLLILFLSSLGITYLFSSFIFEQIPHVHDSIAYLFQAKIFAQGKLYLSPPLFREFFEVPFIIDRGKWYSQYPPGHSVLLSLGVLLGRPWLMNPLIGSLLVVLIYFLGKEMYEPRAAKLSALFAFLCPFLLFMSSEYMAHVTGALFFGIFLLCFLKALKGEKWHWSLLSGGALGFAIATRPASALMLSLPYLLYVIGAKRWSFLIKRALLFSLGLALFLIPFLFYNYFTNGHPLRLGYQVLHGSGHALGFGMRGFYGSGGFEHTPLKGLANTIKNLHGLNVFLFEWPLPCLLFLFSLILPLKGRNRWDYLGLASFFSLVTFYFFFFYQDLCFGPRFLFEALPVMVLLSVRGIYCLSDTLREPYGQKGDRFIFFLVLFCFLYALFYSIPARVEEYSHSYWGVDDSIYQEVKKKGLKEALVFIMPSEERPFNSVFSRNPLDLQEGVIFARDLYMDKNILLMKQYPDKEYYLYDGTLRRLYLRGPEGDNP